MKKANFSLSGIVPVTISAVITGILAGGLTTLYKFLAGKAVTLSGMLYDKPVLLLLLLAVIPGLAFLLAKIYRKAPELQGGGIPGSISAIRGHKVLPWLRNTIGPFFLSLLSFVLGVPLGTEGPSVQFSTAMGGGVSDAMPRKWRKWKPLTLTAGASAGFAVATGSPVAGILFSIEEAHRTISPLILLATTVAVLFANVTARFLSPLLGVDVALFTISGLPKLTLSQLWLPAVMGLIMGLFAAAFLRFHLVLRNVLKKAASRLPQWLLISIIFVLTLAAGVLSPEFISTGHHLVAELLHENPGLWLLLLIVVLRTVLTLSANATGITGGTFLPQLAIGAAAAAAAGTLLIHAGLAETYYPMLVVFGLCGCVAGMMKMPITAIAFSVEALGLSENLLPALLVIGISYLLPKLLKQISVTDYVLEQTHEKSTV